MNRPIEFRTPNFKDGKFSHFNYWGAIDHKGNHSDEGDCFTSPGQSSGCIKGWHEQFTGMLDSNGNKIFENDILEYFHIECEEISYQKVLFKDGCFMSANIDECVLIEDLNYKDLFKITVSGSVHENLNLLEK